MKLTKETKEAILRVNNKVLKQVIEDEIDSLIVVLKVRDDVRYTQGSVNALEEVLYLLTK
jgi:hypothetical protein